MAEKIEGVLEGICPTCDEEAVFDYLGPFELIKGEKHQFYNCRRCSSTVSLERFNEINYWDIKGLSQ